MQAYEPCHDRFLRYCSALAYGKMDVEDLVQDVLLSAYQHFDQIQKKDQFLHYLISAARRRFISRLRRPVHTREIALLHAGRMQAQGVSPEMLLDIQLLYRALDRLPPKQRDAVILFEISGFSMKEIAGLQGSTEGAVKTRISRGRKRLGDLLREKDTSQEMSSIIETIKSVLL